MILVGIHPLQSFPTSGLRASPPAHPSPLSTQWDAICPPRHHCHCHYRATISTFAHPGYRPDADVHVCSSYLTSSSSSSPRPQRRQRHQRHHNAVTPKTEEIVPFPSTQSVVAFPFPLLPPFFLISTPPERDGVRRAQGESFALVVARMPSPPKGRGTRRAMRCSEHVGRCAVVVVVGVVTSFLRRQW